MSAAVEVRHLRHRYGAKQAGHVIDDVSFEVEQGEFLVLLGPSGCGKTTTLRCIAGLERPTEGTILLGGKTIVEGRRSVPTHRRNIGMVFQDYAVWPHMSVFDNVAFPLRMGKRENKASSRARVTEALRTVGLEHLADRDGTQLSGGQQQRLSLARALVREPAVLLLDEPLSNLDAGLRERMRTEIRDVQQRLGIATVLVTHDQIEALSMATRVILMNNGRIVQASTPRELYERPVNKFAAEFVGTASFYDGTVLQVGPADDVGRRAIVLDTALGTLHATSYHDSTVGEAVSVVIRPQQVVAHRVAPSASENVFAGKIRNVLYLGNDLDLHIEAGGQMLRAEVAAETGPFSVDDSVHIQLAPHHVNVVAA